MSEQAPHYGPRLPLIKEQVEMGCGLSDHDARHLMKFCEALAREFVPHDSGCPFMVSPALRCDCGRGEALARIDAEI